MNTTLIDEKNKLIRSEEFDKALDEAAEIKKETLTLCKSRKRNNFVHFHDVMVVSNPKIQSLLDTKKSHRSQQDNDEIKKFKKYVSTLYKQVCFFLTPEEVEEDEETSTQKMVKRIAIAVRMLDYLGNNDLDDEFEKYGIKLDYKKLNEEDTFSNENIKKDIESIFNTGKTIIEDIRKNEEKIMLDIFENSVPTDLQFDKEMNPVGIKNTDFSKLVGLKTKLLMAKDDEQKEKVDDQASNLAGQYEFNSARNKIMQTKLLEINSED